MEKVIQIQQLLLRSKRLPWLVSSLALAVLAGTILLASFQLRQRVREQIARRDAEVLQAVALMHQREVAKDLGELGGIDDPINQLTVLFKTSSLRGVLAVRLFDGDGRFLNGYPKEVLAARLDSAFLPQLDHLQPVCRYHKAVPLSDLFREEQPEVRGGHHPVPLLEVNVPFQSAADGRLAGVGQFIIEGHSIAAEYGRLDRHLALQASAAFVVGGGVLVGALGWAFRRLQRANRLLAERTDDLLQVNQELALAAKTSAVGAVTSHLIHGLRNPLSGLQNFVANIHACDPARLEADSEQAIASTRRMQTLINQVVSVLREEEAGRQYEITLAELADIISGRVLQRAREKGVAFQARLTGDAALPNRTANLVSLVLVNLVQNALDATPPGKAVCLSLAHGAEGITCEVRDEGSGLPEALRQNPFRPCQSTKEGGSGIGLAICKQLANHLGAKLELKTSSSAGCVFVLRLARVACEPGPQSTTVTMSG